jgi:peptidoglycan/LPS O-acetylase OafA/YrhL
MRRWRRGRAEDGGAAPGGRPVGERALGHEAHGRENNLDILRFGAASMVVLSHSYPLSYGSDRFDPLARLTKTATLGSAAVWIFFVLSGFLVAASFERSRSARDYALARSLRILPGLVVVVTLTALVYGPLLTTLPIGDYLTDRATYSYIFWGVVYAAKQWNLPGVLDTGNPWGNAVNGSLWTLVYEMIFYVVVLVLGMTRRLRPWTVAALVILAWYPELWIGHSAFLQHWLAYSGDLFRFFGAGVLLYLLRDRVPLNGRLALLATALLALSGWKGHPLSFPDTAAVVGPYLILWLAYQPHLRLPRFSRFGDFSYGIYIYAFPVEQWAAHVFSPDIRAWKVCALSYPIIVVLAALSWHVVERPSLRLRRRISRAINPASGAAATPRADVLEIRPDAARPV